MKRRVAVETLYVRVPAGTRKLVEAARGRERQSDWLRRTILEAVRPARSAASLSETLTRGRR